MTHELERVRLCRVVSGNTGIAISRTEYAMGWNDNRAELERNISQLKALLDTQPGLPAEVRVTTLAALVQAQSSLLAADTLMSAMHTAEGDVAAPLTVALHAFAEQAEMLSARLGRLPEY